MNDLSAAKVGDILFVTQGHYDKGSLLAVERITPSGRLVTKRGQFKPNGYGYEKAPGFYKPIARLATEDDIKGVNRWALVSKITAFREWEKLSPDDLRSVSDTIGKYQLPR